MRDIPLSPGCYASKLRELSYSMNCLRRMCSLANKNRRIRRYKIKKKIAKRVKEVDIHLVGENLFRGFSDDSDNFRK